MNTNQDLIEKVWAEVEEGIHDATDGLRPFSVFVDNDGDISVAYTCEWTRKVHPGAE